MVARRENKKNLNKYLAKRCAATRLKDITGLTGDTGVGRHWGHDKTYWLQSARQASSVLPSRTSQ